MRFTSILTLAAASSITTVQAAGNFGASCKDIATLVGGTDLVASCRKSNGSYVYAQLDMNKCVANYGGHLACASKWVTYPHHYFYRFIIWPPPQWELWKIVFRLWNQQRYYHSRVHVSFGDLSRLLTCVIDGQLGASLVRAVPRLTWVSSYSAI